MVTPPARNDGPSRSLFRRHGGLLVPLLAVGAVVALAESSLRPSPPRDTSAPTTEFSEQRARRTVEALVRAGVRETGSAAARRAEGYLVEQARALPDVEVRVQVSDDAAADAMVPQRTIAWRTRTVLARRPGLSDGDVLVSAHYDSPPASPGAADNGAGVASALETLRALSQGPRLTHGVLVAFVDGEEVNLAGARSLRSDPWFRSVRAVINLDAGGSGGRAVLLRLERPSPRLLEAFASQNTHPLASSPIETLFRREVLPTVVTDVRAYRSANLPCLELMLFEDAYAYHTALDTPSRLEPGSLQHLGDTTLHAARSLASGPPLPARDAWVAQEPLFVDLAGRWLLRGPAHFFRVGTLLACALALAVLVYARRRAPFSLRALARSSLRPLVALLAAPAAGALAGALLSLAGAAHRWYARPSRAAALAALAAALAVHALAEPDEAPAPSAPSPAPPSTERALLACLALAVLASLASTLLAAPFLPYALVSLLSLSLAVLVRPRAGPSLAGLLAFVPVALLTTELTDGVLRYAFVLLGHVPAPRPLDALICGLAALFAGPPLALLVASFPALRARAHRTPVRVALALALVAAFVSVLSAPGYTAARPKRFLLEHFDDGAHPRLLFRAQDALPPSVAMSAHPWLRTARPIGRDVSVAFEFPLETASLPCEPSRLTPAVVEVLDERALTERTRSVRIRVSPGGTTRLQLRVPREALSGWSLPAPLPALDAGTRDYVIEHMGAAEGENWELTLELTRAPVTVRAMRLSTAPDASDALVRARAALPPWAHALAYVTRVSTHTL